MPSDNSPKAVISSAVRHSPRHASAAESVVPISNNDNQTSPRFRAARNLQAVSPTVSAISDPLSVCDDIALVKRAATGLVYDRLFLDHVSLWRDQHPESPRRLECIYQTCVEWGLVERCVRVPARAATHDELLTVHTAEHVRHIRDMCDQPRHERTRQYCLDSDVFVSSKSFEAASYAFGSAIELTDRILNGSLQNAFLLARPPAHHASADAASGYCLFNHTAAAVYHAASESTRRVLLVDWDVHYGQGSQAILHQLPNVLCFSVHRHEQGEFWPHLHEADARYTGTNSNVCNVALNVRHITDTDMLAVWHRVLLPIAYEFAPDLVVVSAGFDMALGDPKGEMCVTPSCFAHLTHALTALAGGRLLAVLEGGYNCDATAAAAAHTLRCLLGHSPPSPLLAPSGGRPVHPSVERSIMNTIYHHRRRFKCFSIYPVYSATRAVTRESQRRDSPNDSPAETSSDSPHDELFRPTTDRVCPQSDSQYDMASTHGQMLDKLADFCAAPVDDQFSCGKVVLLSNEIMSQHRNVSDPDHPECPQRLTRIMSLLDEWQLSSRCGRLVCHQPASPRQLQQLHRPQLVQLLADSCAKHSQQQLDSLADGFNSVYLCKQSYDCAALAAGCVIQAVDCVLKQDDGGGVGSGVCVVRPPGHHAEPAEAHGFCLFNNVALAAQHALTVHQLQRVLVLDWDVHHGNGIQHMFYEQCGVLYISLHRYDDGVFFPTSPDGGAACVGRGAGRGYNVNVPWNGRRLGDAEYLAAWLAVVMPIACQFAPQLVLVAGGFDAARGDPLGGYRVSPEFYGHMCHHLRSLASGRLVLALEGGYSLTSTSYGVAMCVKALLGDPLAQLPPTAQAVKPPAAACLRRVMRVQRPLWPCVATPLALPTETFRELREANIPPPQQHHQTTDRAVDQLSQMMSSTTLVSNNDDCRACDSHPAPAANVLSQDAVRSLIVSFSDAEKLGLSSASTDTYS